MSFGFGFGFTKITAAIRAAFSPSSLFAANEPGVWYDPSDLSTLFQDAAGATPVTAVEQPVGLMLDKSKGLVLGPELVTNGDFSGGSTGWDVGANWSVSGGLASHAAGAAGELSQLLTIKSGMGYRLTFTISNLTAGSGYIQFAAGGFQSLRSVSANGTYTITVTANSAYTRVGVVALSAASFSVDNISVRELPGNHAYQTTATSRPVLSARVNLLTKTEDVSVSPWQKQGSITPTPTSVLETATTGFHGVAQSTGVTIPSGTSCVFSAKVKANGRNYVLLYSNQGAVGKYFDITPGTSGAVLGDYGAAISGTISPLGNGEFLCSITFTSGGTGAFAEIYISDTGSRSSYAGDTTKGVNVLSASLTPANQAHLPYQRVNTATDYDTAGFPHYLRFDGVDDWLVTNTITPGIDKAQVFAGARKLSDATPYQVLLESSPTYSTNNGAFILSTSWNASQYAAGSNGTSFVNCVTSPLSAPRTNVATMVSSIAEDTLLLRINGTQAASSTADQGTGNFGNHQLYIGRRGGTSNPFNGHIYSLIVRFGSNLPAATIENTEKYINTKTRAY